MKKKNINQLKTGVLLSYMTMGLNMLIQLIYTPIMIRFLGQSEYGLYTLVGSFISYLSLLVWALLVHICDFILDSRLKIMYGKSTNLMVFFC